MHIGTYKDKFFSGIHLYISDTLPESNNRGDILEEEIEFWNYLHYNVTVITGTLADGQHAAIKIGGTFTQRTIEYMFLLKLAFNRVYFYKWIGSNAFTNDKYVVCEYFNQENGRHISKYLLNNFD